MTKRTKRLETRRVSVPLAAAPERREWVRSAPLPAERDVTGRETQRVVRFDCPFCGASVKGYAWSLHGRGKRCGCGALHIWGTSYAPAPPRVRVEETPGSKPGRREAEAFAPDGYAFDGDRHSLVARGATLAEAMRTATEDAKAARLVRCAADCSCSEASS